MTYTLSLRSQIYEPLEALKEPLTRAVTYLKGFRRDYYAEWASTLIKRACSTVGRILNYRCDDQSTTLYLEQVTRWLNIVATRTRELYPQIATIAGDLYEQFFTLFPFDLSLQLELFDYGELKSSPMPLDFVLPAVKDFLDYWLTPLAGQQTTRWFLVSQSGSRFRSIEGEQLSLDFRRENEETMPVCAEQDSPTNISPEESASSQRTRDEYEEFTITVNGNLIKVRYNPTWSSTLNLAHVEFHSPASPAQPIPVSSTGYRSHFFTKEHISSFNSLEHYAVSFCVAMLRNKRQEPSFEQILQVSKGVERPTSHLEDGELTLALEEGQRKKKS